MAEKYSWEMETPSLEKDSPRLSCVMPATSQGKEPASRESRRQILMANLTFSFFQFLHKSNLLALLDYMVLDCLQVNA